MCTGISMWGQIDGNSRLWFGFVSTWTKSYYEIGKKILSGHQYIWKSQNEIYLHVNQAIHNCIQRIWTL